MKKIILIVIFILTWMLSGCCFSHEIVIDNEIESTCITEGLTEGSHCSVCDKVIIEQQVIPMKEHTEVIDEGYEATCTTEGLTDGSHCSVCNKIIIEQQVIPMKEHTEVIDEGYEATCTTEGLTEGSHCSVCNKIIIEQQVIPMKEHTEVIDEGYEATCTTEGLTDGSHCSVCNKVIIEQQVIPMKEHTEVIDEGYEATCTTEGLTEGSHCSVCDKVIIEQELIVKLEHCYNDDECTLCHRANFTNISMYSSHRAEEFFEKQSNGYFMQRLYNEMEQVLNKFHNDANQNAVYRSTNPVFGNVYTVASFNYEYFNLSRNEAKAVFSLFRNDHPIFYWMTSYYPTSMGSLVVTTTEEYAQGKDRVKYNEIAYKKIEEYASLVEEEEHLYNKILIYYEAILKENSYAYNEEGSPESAQWAHSIIGGFLYNKFVCEGYAKLFQLLLNYSDIDNYYVRGISGGGGHAWNLVCLDDGKWYWFDATWDDTSYRNTYKYFCVMDNAFIGSHKPHPANKLDYNINPELPERATTNYKNSEILEIGEEIVVTNGAFTSVFALSSYRKLKYVGGLMYQGDQIEYNGVIYDIIK